MTRVDAIELGCAAVVILLTAIFTWAIATQNRRMRGHSFSGRFDESGNYVPSTWPGGDRHSHHHHHHHSSGHGGFDAGHAAGHSAGHGGGDGGAGGSH